MDPKVLSTEIKKEAKLLPRRLILLILIVALIFIVLAGGFYYYKSLSRPASIPFTNKGYQLHQTIVQTLDRSNKYSPLVKETDTAILEKNQEIKYQQLKSLFISFKQVYKETKDAKVLAALYQLKNYAKSVKDYTEADFLIRQPGL